MDDTQNLPHISTAILTKAILPWSCGKFEYAVFWPAGYTNINKMAAQSSHVCDFEGCGKTFGKEIRLVEHKRMHTGEVKKTLFVFFFQRRWLNYHRIQINHENT